MTMSAPSCERMMSSTAWRSSVPGAIVSIACSRAGSRRGSSSDGVRVYPGSPPTLVSFVSFGSIAIEPRLDRLTQRLGLRNCNLATGGRSGRRDDAAQAELRALLEAAVRLRRRAQPPGEAELPERGDAALHGHALGRRRDRERDRKVRSRLVDAYAAGDVDEHVGLAERD